MAYTEHAKPRLTSATLSWFDDGCCDVIYLDIWQNTAVSFTPPAQIDESWQVYRRQIVLAHDNSGELFRQAEDLLMRFHFYPNNLMSRFGDFDLRGGRRLRPGDRVVQRFHVWRLFGRPFLDVLGLVEITRVVTEPNRVGFDYASVSPHAIEGHWSVCLSHKANGELLLEMEALSRPSVQEPAHTHGLIRRWQEQFLQQGVCHFQQLITEKAAVPN